MPALAVPVVTASTRVDGTAALGALPPAIILGGYAGSAISVARSLGTSGVRVYLLARADSPENYSRYIRIVPLPEEDPPTEVWTRYLLGPASDPLRGAVLLTCSDAGIEVLLRHREELARKFVLDISNTEAQRFALNKLSTYRRAAEAGIATPRFWEADSIEAVLARRGEHVYPMMVKPLYSHQFTAVFGKKYLPARDFNELVRAFREVNGHDLEALLSRGYRAPMTQRAATTPTWTRAARLCSTSRRGSFAATLRTRAWPSTTSLTGSPRLAIWGAGSSPTSACSVWVRSNSSGTTATGG